MGGSSPLRCSTDLDLHALGEADALLGHRLVGLVRQQPESTVTRPGLGQRGRSADAEAQWAFVGPQRAGEHGRISLVRREHGLHQRRRALARPLDEAVPVIHLRGWCVVVVVVVVRDGG